MTLNRIWQFIQNVTHILWHYLLIETVVLNIHRNIFLQLVWNPISLRELEQGVKLNLHVVSAHINLIQDRLDVTNDVCVESDSEDHPDDCYDTFIVSDRPDIAVPHSRQRLERPVHGG